jgi:hypothetical protein
MTNVKSFKYVSLFINKTFNNLLWRSVIYDSDCNDSLTYHLNWFVNEITFAHELIDTFNNSIMIAKYEIMLVIDRINKKNRKMFFDNIVYVSFIDVILMFVTRLKKQDFVWDMYKKTLMIKSTSRNDSVRFGFCHLETESVPIRFFDDFGSVRFHSIRVFIDSKSSKRVQKAFDLIFET